MTKTIFQDLLQTLAKDDKYWQHGNDCTKQTKIMPEVKLLCALKVISYSVSFGTFSDYFQMGESTTRQAVSKLARKDKATSKIIEEDLFFENNKQKLDLDSNKIDLELLHKYRHAQNLGQRLQIINR